MNPNPVDELPLLELFTRLREAGLPLGINEYQLLLQSLQAGFGIRNRASLAKLCRTLWIKSVEEERLFNHHFEQIIGSVSSGSVSSSLKGKTQDNRQPLRQLSELSSNLKRSSYFLQFYRQFNRFERWLLLSFSTVILILSIQLTSSEVIPFFKTYFAPLIEAQTHPVPSTNSNPTIVVPKQTQDSNASDSPYPIPSVPLSLPAAAAQDPPWLTAFKFYWSFFGAPIGYLLSILVITWVLWTARQRMKRQEQRHAATEVTASSHPNQLSTELVQQIGDEVRVARVVRRRLRGDTDVGDRVLTNPEFFPITRRQMKQSWRYLRCLTREGAPTEIDIDATIHRIGQQGLLLEPVLVPGRVNRTELLLLIDQDGSMVPFHSLSQRLIQTAVQGGRLGKADVYYFHNCPTDYVYRDPVHQEAVAIDDFWLQLNACTTVLIFSDAGSARGGFNHRRRRATKAFLDDLKQHVRYIAWLNPMPRSRWAGTTAGEIDHVIPMFEMSRQGLDGAIDVLRGRYK